MRGSGCLHHDIRNCVPLVAFGVVKGIRADLNMPRWILAQFQERGSYRTEDCLDFLEWALEPAACPQQSTIVMLDWFAPHLSPEVAELVSKKGHMLLHHGGGVTGLEQVNAARPGIHHIFSCVLCPYVVDMYVCIKMCVGRLVWRRILTYTPPSNG